MRKLNKVSLWKREEEDAVSPVVIQLLPLLAQPSFVHTVHQLLCTSFATENHRQMTTHFANSFASFTRKEAECTQPTAETNLWHVREAISELLLLQLPPVHVHFTKELVFMVQSS